MLPLRETRVDRISEPSSDEPAGEMNVHPDETDAGAKETNNDLIAVDSIRDHIVDLETDGAGVAKKRTWKKPKDKPKRPLSSYNIFFQHQRERIVEGMTGEASPEEVMQSVEAILSKCRQKRRHRKSHGKISFGDLARTIADNWKSVSPTTKTIFEHYAERDMLRYKKELKVWKDRKDLVHEQTTLAKHSNFINSMSASMASESSTSEYLERLPGGGSDRQSGSWHHGRFSSFGGQQGDVTSFNSSMSSLDSQSAHFPGSDSEPMQKMLLRQQQILQRQMVFDNSASMVPQSSDHAGTSMPGGGMMMTPGSSAFHASFTNFPSMVPSSGASVGGSIPAGGSGGFVGAINLPGSLGSGSLHGLPLRQQHHLQLRMQQEQPMMVSNNSAMSTSMRNSGQDSFSGGGFLQQDSPQHIPSMMGPSMMGPSTMGMQHQQFQQMQQMKYQQQLHQLQLQRHHLQQQIQPQQHGQMQMPQHQHQYQHQYQHQHQHQQAVAAGIGRSSTASLQLHDDLLFGSTSHSISDVSTGDQNQNSYSTFGHASTSQGLGSVSFHGGGFGSSAMSGGLGSGSMHGSSMPFGIVEQNQQHNSFHQLDQHTQHFHRASDQMPMFGLGGGGGGTIDEHNHEGSTHLSSEGGYMRGAMDMEGSNRS